MDYKEFSVIVKIGIHKQLFKFLKRILELGKQNNVLEDNTFIK
jgi:hypothetical protein